MPRASEAGRSDENDPERPIGGPMGRHPLTSTSDPKHWLDQAEEMRAIADSLDW
jgi:hypothetical protein